MKHYYKEKQKIDTIWPLLILAVTSLVNYVQYFHLDLKDMNFFYGSIISSSLICAILLLFSMKTEMNEEEILYAIFPLHFKKQSIKWDQVEDAHIVKYKPIKEYGGWGIRYGKSGRAYTISGDKGLQLVLKTGKKVLIGTHKEDELEAFIRKLGYNK